MTEHRASCQCSALRLTMSADPAITVCCNCRACRKRTGSSHAAVAYVPKDAVTIEGERTGWARRADSGRILESFFCPACGTTVYWTLEFRSDKMGVLLGAFDTPPPTPSRTVWNSEKLPWISFPEDWEHLPEGSPAA